MTKELENDFLIGNFEMSEAKRIASDLLENEIYVSVKCNDHTCARGCKISVELWGNRNDVQKLSEYFRAKQMKDLEGLDVNFDHLKEVFDPNAKSVICQACGAQFAPNAKECPDCGLVYITD